MELFDRLQVAQKAHETTLAVFEVVKSFPREERYELTSQIRRACTSIGSNLAEGEAHPSKRVFRSHVGIALGSTAEVQYQLTLAFDLGYATSDDIETLQARLQEVRRMLIGLYRSIDRKLQGR